MLSELEVQNMLSLYKKGHNQNLKDQDAMQKIHARAFITVKKLTRSLAESATPIMVVLQKLKEVNKENIKLLLFRCNKLY